MPEFDLNALFSRRLFMGSALTIAGVGALTRASPTLASSDLDTSTVVEDGGRYSQNWFLDSFLELPDDLAESTGNGKRLAIIWEQKGCPYCRETHLVNFSTPVVRDWIRERFNIIQLDIWGAREVVDFDGEALEERALARKSRVTFTPTIQFFPETPDEVAGKGGASSEVARMPGYFKPFHFLTMFEYVHAKAYGEMEFQRFLQVKIERLQAEGKEADVW